MQFVNMVLDLRCSIGERVASGSCFAKIKPQGRRSDRIEKDVLKRSFDNYLLINLIRWSEVIVRLLPTPRLIRG